MSAGLSRFDVYVARYALTFRKTHACRYEQFDPRYKFANFYFLIICVLQTLDAISITNGYPVCINALAFVIFVQFALTLKETISRCSNDRVTNSKPVDVFDRATRTLQPRTWGDVRIGDVVRVNRGEFFPADLVLMATSSSATTDVVADLEPTAGSCFINTQNLDGETNHKVRKVPHNHDAAKNTARKRAANVASSLRRRSESVVAADVAAVANTVLEDDGWRDAEIQCESFNSRTTEFTAAITFAATITTTATARTGSGASATTAAATPTPITASRTSLTIDNLLLRGCVLVDCAWVLGVAVAVGSKSKCFYQEGDDDDDDGDADAVDSADLKSKTKGCCKKTKCGSSKTNGMKVVRT